jgi:hypothetical protein
MYTSDERLVHDLPRGRGRPISGDLDIGEDGFEQMIITLQSLHHDLASPKRLIPTTATENTSKNRKECN